MTPDRNAILRTIAASAALVLVSCERPGETPRTGDPPIPTVTVSVPASLKLESVKVRQWAVDDSYQVNAIFTNLTTATLRGGLLNCRGFNKNGVVVAQSSSEVEDVDPGQSVLTNVVLDELNDYPVHFQCRETLE